MFFFTPNIAFVQIMIFLKAIEYYANQYLFKTNIVLQNLSYLKGKMF